MKLNTLFLLAQDLFVWLESLIPPEVNHNIEKHRVLKKMFFYKHIESLPGDYLEFGVYQGTSLKGAAQYWRKIGKQPMRFWGFDSFEGMRGEKGDEHPFYLSFDFSTDFEQVRKRFRNFPEVSLVKGFYKTSLKKGAKALGIKRAGMVFLDCDLYSSSQQALKFLTPIVGDGTIFILDDYFNYAANKQRGVQAAFAEFTAVQKWEVIELDRYGIGGIVFIIKKPLRKTKKLSTVKLNVKKP